VSMFECPRVDDAAGYVLRAMSDAEAESYRHHAAECEQCAAKVAELGFVSHALLNAVPQLTAPPDIRNRVMAVVRAEAELLNAAGASADRPPQPARRRLDWGIGRLRLLTTGAFAACLIALGVGAGALLRGGPDGQCKTRSASVQRPGGGSGELTVCPSNAKLRFARLESPSANSTYQVWFVKPKDPGHPRPGELFTPRDGSAAVDVSALRSGEVVMVTEEPAGGSKSPRGKVFFQASA